MSFLDSALASLGFEYFCSRDEYLLLFRGAVIDHPVLVRESEAFVHATAVLCRLPDPLDPDLSSILLEWNAQHNMARLAVAKGQALALAELPLQGLQTEGVETLILSVASTAEEFSQRVLPRLLSGACPGLKPDLEVKAARERDQEPETPSQPEPAPPTGAPEDTDIDWDTEG